MDIIATKLKAKELKAGDLFSAEGPDYWGAERKTSDGRVGEKVYIRTETPCPTDQEEDDVFLINIQTPML